MLYIDPKDQEITTKDDLLAKVWIERKNKRFDLFRLQREIEELDKFISMYTERSGATYQPTLHQFMQPCVPETHG